jgi:uncharacterized protein
MLPTPGRRANGRDKFSRFHNILEASGRIRPFNGKIESWSYEPLREMERVAGLVREAYLAR